MPEPQTADLTSLSASEFDAVLGGMVRASLLRDGACVVLAKGDQECTVLDPRILDALPEAAFVDALVNRWPDDQILRLLAEREARKVRRAAEPA